MFGSTLEYRQLVDTGYSTKGIVLAERHGEGSEAAGQCLDVPRCQGWPAQVVGASPRS